MTTQTAMTVSLTPRWEAFIQSKVASGRYGSASEVVGEALRLLEEKEVAREGLLADLREKVAIGLEAARNGDLHDGEAFFLELEREELEAIPPEWTGQE